MVQDKEYKLLDTLPQGVESFDDVPDCPKELCQEMQAQIGQICHQKGRPPGYPILICLPGGKVCKCYCK